MYTCTYALWNMQMIFLLVKYFHANKNMSVNQKSTVH